MSDPIKLAEITDVPEGTVRVFDFGNRQVALFNIGGKFYACDNTCPHSGGPLGEGTVDGNTVTCPWHNWVWSVETGECISNSVTAKRVSVLPVQVDGNDIKVAL